jgi:hypothetical protein
MANFIYQGSGPVGIAIVYRLLMFKVPYQNLNANVGDLQKRLTQMPRLSEPF